MEMEKENATERMRLRPRTLRWLLHYKASCGVVSLDSAINRLINFRKKYLELKKNVAQGQQLKPIEQNQN